MTVPDYREVAEAPKAFALIYVSAAVTPKTQAELASLLVQFRKNNTSVPTFGTGLVE